MINETMTNEERGLTDKLQFFFEEKIEVHFKLHRRLPTGEPVFLNGLIKERSNERVWLLQERKLGEIRISISEIKSVEEARG